MQPSDIEHHATCNANYPEKAGTGEAPRATTTIDLDDGFKALVCVDCGAQVNNLPPLEDPYWDDVRDDLAA